MSRKLNWRLISKINVRYLLFPLFGLMMFAVNVLEVKETPSHQQRITNSNGLTHGPLGFTNSIERELGLLRKGANLTIRDETRLLIFVVSKPSHFYRRTYIRSNWGSEVNQQKYRWQIYFVLGRSNVRVQAEVSKEELIHEDVLMSNIVDSYRNLTLKTLSIMSAVKNLDSKNFSVELVMKVDDDVVIDSKFLDKFLTIHLQNYKLPTNQIACSLNSAANVIRNKKSKWFVSEEEYSIKKTNDVFPPYCDGPMYIFHKTLPQKIFSVLREHFRNKAMLWIEDAFLTGILAQKADIQPTDYFKATKEHTLFTKFRHFNDFLVYFGEVAKGVSQTSNHVWSKMIRKLKISYKDWIQQ